MPDAGHGWIPLYLDGRLGRLVADESDNHAVEIEEEHDQMETKLEKGFLVRVRTGCALPRKRCRLPSCEH